MKHILNIGKSMVNKVLTELHIRLDFKFYKEIILLANIVVEKLQKLFYMLTTRYLKVKVVRVIKITLLQPVLNVIWEN